MRYSILLFSAFALYAIFYFSTINGLQRLALEAIASQTLPGSTDALRTVYVGIEPIDRLLTILTTFFWPAIDGRNPTLTLHSVAFAGTFGAAWVLVTLEAWRTGNAWTIAAFPAIFGLTAQVMTFAFAMPLYCGLHLAHSPTATHPTAQNMGIPRAVLHATPVAFVLGYFLPSGLSILPAPSVVSVHVKQMFIAIWQPWPAYVSMMVTLADMLVSSCNSNSNSKPDRRADLSALRRVYAFAFGTAAIPHIITWTVSLAAMIVPVVFHEDYVDSLHPARVFAVEFPTSGLQVPDVAEGVHVFLRWDYLIGSAGVLVWALALYVNAHRAVGRMCWGELMVKTGLLAVVVGPVGAAVELMWERDELVKKSHGK